MEMVFEADQEIRKSYSAKKASDEEFVSRIIAEDKARRARTAELLNHAGGSCCVARGSTGLRSITFMLDESNQSFPLPLDGRH
jgi:hypothetical protein